jgi:hypothetical protein
LVQTFCCDFESPAAAMHHFDLWKLSSEYSIIHAALIISGHSPEETERMRESDFASKLPGYLAAKTAVYNAVRSGVLEADVVHDGQTFEDPGEINLYRTLISVYELRSWLRGRGVICELFERSAVPEISDELASNRRYPPKLDAAIRAWQAVTSDPSRLAGRSPKQALEKWLTENALSLGLTNRDGQPNKTGIEEICKVANWKPEGGATPTPGPVIVAGPMFVRLPGPADKAKVETPWIDIDDEIPF